MDIEARISAFHELGEKIERLGGQEFGSLADMAAHQNPWFTGDNIRLSLNGIRNFLQRPKLESWTSRYKLPAYPTNRSVALVLAGNIPLVGFHDVLSVLISGHSAMIKMSSKDTILLPAITNMLTGIEPGFKDRVQFVEQLKSFDAVIATGSDNSARYFGYYFGKYPHIIRKNRTSCAVLTGNESTTELEQLGQDVFSYFGLGCRNVSKLFVPEGYSFNQLFECWQERNNIIHHHKYSNNYDYQKATLLVTQQPFLDNGFVLLMENQKTVSPIATVYFEYYRTQRQLTDRIETEKDKIQCIVGHAPPASIPFGQAQCPEPWDYADNIDTLEFLTELPAD